MIHPPQIARQCLEVCSSFGCDLLETTARRLFGWCLMLGQTNLHGSKFKRCWQTGKSHNLTVDAVLFIVGWAVLKCTPNRNFKKDLHSFSDTTRVGDILKRDIRNQVWNGCMPRLDRVTNTCSCTKQKVSNFVRVL